jgi:PAS domain S-box-containing protein
MSALALPVVAIAGLSLYVAFYNLLIYFRRPQHREHLTFALASLAMGLYDIFSAGLYGATSVTAGVRWQRWQVATLALASIAFSWFVLDYFAHTGQITRRTKIVVLAFSIYSALAAIVGLVDPTGLYWPANRPLIKQFTLPFGTRIVYYEMAQGPLADLQSVVGIALFIYVLWVAIRMHRRGYRREALPLILALGIFFVGAINDAAVSAGLYQFFYTLEYACLGMVLLMTYSLTSKVVAAAATEDALQQRSAQLEALRRVGLELTAQLDVDTLLESIARKSMELLRGDGAGLYLYRPDRDVIEWALGIGSGQPAIGTILHRGEGLSGRVWVQGEPLVVNDYWHWDGRAPVHDGLPNVAAVAAPVHWGGELLGVLNVVADVPHTFTPADAELLVLFATWVAIALRNARLYEETRRRAERLAVVNHVARAVGATLRLDDLLETVYREITPLFSVDSFFIALYDQAAQEIEFRIQVDEGVRLPPDRQDARAGLTSRVIAETKPLLVHDFAQEQEHLPAPVFYGTMRPPRSWLGVPMCVGERVIGVISVQSYSAHAYNEDDQLLLATIADQVAVAVEQARLYQTLRDSEEKYRALFDQANDAVFLETLDGRILEVNERACQLLGYSRQELLRLSVADIVPPEIRDKLPQVIQEEVTRGSIRLEAENLRRDGSRVPVEVSTALLEIGGQGLVLALAHDITDRRRAEEQLRQAQKMEAVGTLAGGIAHDFNNILTGILGHASLVQQDLPPESPLYGDLGRIIHAAGRAADLTRQLLTFARRSPQVEMQPLDLNALVREVADLLGHTIDKSIAVELYLAPGLRAVCGDAGQLHQTILNLGLNARDAMPQGGRLTIETANVDISAEQASAAADMAAGEYVLLSVTDTGTGMQPAVQERIFEPFFTTKDQGRGLGLAIVYGILRGHGGTVRVQSEPGKGATFQVYLPAYRGPAASAPTGELSVPGGRETVLVVDDEEAVRGVLQGILERAGYTVLPAESGVQAVNLYRDHGAEIDLVVLDVTMPHMGGWETCMRLRELSPQVKVLLSSGYSEDSKAAEILAQGAQGFLQKPYVVEEVLRKVRQTLDSSSTAG